MKFYPTCNYCGQRQFTDDSFDTQEDANEHATLNCGCREAKEYKDERQRKKKREENIKLIKDSIESFKTFCELRKAELTDERQNIIFITATAVLDDMMYSAAVAFANVKVSIKKTGKDKIDLKCTCTDSVTAEV
jgi:hypothetical protein